MLALMYAGELCYWAWELRGGVEREEEEEEGEKKEKAKSGGHKSDCNIQNKMEFVNELDTSAVCNLSSEDNPLPIQPATIPPLFSGLISQLKGADYTLQYCKEFSPVTTGQRLLGKYITLAQGPLKNQNWNYLRAAELVRKLKDTILPK